MSVWDGSIEDVSTITPLIVKAPTKPLAIIMSGVACSGKTTWVKKYYRKFMYISRDAIRVQMAGGKYVFDPQMEDRVTKEVNHLCAIATANKGCNVVIDQTNCKAGYLNSFIEKFKPTHNIQIVVLYQPLWKLYVRNYWRWVQTGKWIPLKVIRDMYNNQKKMPWANWLDYIKSPEILKYVKS